MSKSRFNSEQEANEYKRKHQLHNRVAEPITGTGTWALNFPIEAHIMVNDGVPANLREVQRKMTNTNVQRQCPTNKRHPDDVVGCGSKNVTEPDEEGLCDCNDCGIWFRGDESTEAQSSMEQPRG